MSKKQHDDHSNSEQHGGSVATYIIIAVILGIVTYGEFALVEFNFTFLSEGGVLFWLVLLSLFKFGLVIAFFMHLKYDGPLLSGLFGSGMVLAVGTLVGLSLLFSVRSLAFGGDTLTGAPPAEERGVLLAEHDFAEAEHLYEEACSSCHGEGGLGIPSAIPPLAGQTALLAQAEGGREYLINTVLYGVQGEIEVLDSTYRGVMPSRAELSNVEVAQVLNYTLAAFGNLELLPENIEAFSAEEVAAQREQALSAQEVLALRSKLTIPELDADALAELPLRSRGLVAQMANPAPKNLGIELPPPDVLASASGVLEATTEGSAETTTPLAAEVETEDNTIYEDPPFSGAPETEIGTDEGVVPQDRDAPDEQANDDPAQETKDFTPEEATNADAAVSEAPAAATEAKNSETDAAATDTAPDTAEAETAETTEPAETDAAFAWQELGTQVYTTNCSSCHQANGQGIPSAFPPLAGHLPAVYSADGGRDYLIHVLLYGLQGEISVSGQTYNGVMPAWAQLSDEQIAAVLNHELTSWENEGVLEPFEPILPADVAAQRDQGLSAAEVYELRQSLGLE